MVEYAFAHPVARDKIEDFRKLAAELEGERHDEHRRFLLEQGVHRERVFLQRMPEGPALSLLHWDCDDPAQTLRWAELLSPHAQFIRDRIIKEIAGVPEEVIAAGGGMSVNEQIMDAAGVPGQALTTYAFALPIVPGKEDAAIAIGREATTGAGRTDFATFLLEAGIHRERAWIQRAPDGSPGPSLVIVVRDCDDPQTTIERGLRGTSGWARRLQDEILPDIHGVDFSDRVPRPNELVSMTHVRRSDAAQDPVKALLLRGYEAFGRGDFDALAQVMAPDVSWTTVGDNPIAGTYEGRDDVFGFFGHLFEETAGTLRVNVEEVLVGDGTGMVVQHDRAERAGRTLDARSAIHFTIRDGMVVAAHQVPMEDPAAVDAFWS